MAEQDQAEPIVIVEIDPDDGEANDVLPRLWQAEERALAAQRAKLVPAPQLTKSEPLVRRVRNAFD